MMDIKMGVTGIQEVKIMLRYVAKKVPDNGRKQMHKIADEIVKEAKLNAPRDTGALEDSIRAKASYEGSGRLAINIVMGGFVDGVDVDLYAVKIHENYSQMGVGPGTLAKRTANPGRYIGEKFLTRAEEAVTPKVNGAIIQAIKEIVEL